MKSKTYEFAVCAVLLSMIAELIWSPNARISMTIVFGATLGLVLLAAAATLLVKFVLPNGRLKRALLRLHRGRASD